jgi:hypothetical protein
MELVNTAINSRRRLLRVYGTVFAGLILIFCIRYFFAPEAYQSGRKSSRSWFSLTDFLVFSTLAFGILSWIILGSKIVVRLIVDEASDLLTIQYIGRYRFRPGTAIARISETQVYIERLENSYWFHKKEEDHVSVYLTHPGFGSIRVGPQDFGMETHQLAEYLQRLKDIRAERIRRSRIFRRGRRSGAHRR